MFDRDRSVAMEQSLKGSDQVIRPRTKLERLRDMKSGMESKLGEVNKAIELLESNPQLTKIIDALEKVNV